MNKLYTHDSLTWLRQAHGQKHHHKFSCSIFSLKFRTVNYGHVGMTRQCGHSIHPMRWLVLSVGELVHYFDFPCSLFTNYMCTAHNTYFKTNNEHPIFFYFQFSCAVPSMTGLDLIPHYGNGALCALYCGMACLWKCRTFRGRRCSPIGMMQWTCRWTPKQRTESICEQSLPYGLDFC